MDSKEERLRELQVREEELDTQIGLFILLQHSSLMSLHRTSQSRRERVLQCDGGSNHCQALKRNVSIGGARVRAAGIGDFLSEGTGPNKEGSRSEKWTIDRV